MLKAEKLVDDNRRYPATNGDSPLARNESGARSDLRSVAARTPTVEKKHYKKFFRSFGRAYRTKHIRLEPANPFLRVFTNLWGGPGWAVQANNRPYYLPWRTGLPKEFIRLDPWEGEYVFTLASLARLGVLEIGRFNGGSVFLMACANPRVPIYSIDIAPQNDELLRSLLGKHGVGENIELIVGDSQRERASEVGRFDLLFVDGDHSYDGCMRDIENWFPLLEPGGHIVFHDAYQGSEVQPAAIDFIARHRVRVVVPPYIPAQHWHVSTGSIVHLIKE